VTRSCIRALERTQFVTYGNLTQQQLYDYPGNPVQPNNSTPFRTYLFTYLTDPNYTSRYIRNRLTAATVNGISLTTKSYDTTTIGPLVDPTQYNGANQPSGQPTPILHD
jgi:hypothetical protein